MAWLLARRLSLAVALIVVAPSASAVTIDWTFVGNPGNAPDTQIMSTDGTTGYGAVSYTYQISKYEVTNAQYAEFLNSKAATDPLELYNTNMGEPCCRGGITRAGSSGSYSYSTIAGRGDMPVNFVSFYDALRFANWLHNGQGSGETETGAYTLLGGTATPSNGTTVTRNPGATIFLTSEDEWYKAAYYDLSSPGYFDYPAGSNTQTTCSAPTATANRANCNNAVGDLTPKGSYTGSASPYGTFDQGGNVEEWNEAIISNSSRGVRGGSFENVPGWDGAFVRDSNQPSFEFYARGFRLAMIPEPGTGLLVLIGMLALAYQRRNLA